MPGGRVFRSSWIVAFTLSATFTVLLSGCRLISSSTAGFPLAVTTVYFGFVPVVTIATSAMCTGIPPLLIFTMICPSCSGLRTCPLIKPSTSW